jgi:hypothetical protein
MVVSSWTVPEASGNFCQRGGRLRRAFLEREHGAGVLQEDRPFIAWFNAGVRAIDLRDPYHPKEVGYFIPAITDKTDKRCVKVDGKDRCKTAIQTNNVETDERGYIYIVDRANTGMHILELGGAARQVAGIEVNCWERATPEALDHERHWSARSRMISAAPSCRPRWRAA